MNFVLFVYLLILLTTGVYALIFYKKIFNLLDNYYNLVEFIDTHFDDFDRSFWEV